MAAQRPGDGRTSGGDTRADPEQPINNAVVRENGDLDAACESALVSSPGRPDSIAVLFRERFPNFPLDRTFTPEQKTYFGNYLAANYIPTVRKEDAREAWQQMQTRSDLRGRIRLEQERQQQVAQAKQLAQELARMHAQRQARLDMREVDLARQRNTIQQTWSQHQTHAQRARAQDKLDELAREQEDLKRQANQQAGRRAQAQDQVRAQTEAQTQSRMTQAQLEVQLQAAQPPQAPKFN